MNDIFFHGTKPSSLKRIIKDGFSNRLGRATFTPNPRYAMNYGNTIIVFKSNKIKLAKESYIKINKKKKLVTGFPNRFRTEQFGYYGRAKLKPIAAFKINNSFANKLNEFGMKVIKGKKINRKSEVTTFIRLFKRNMIFCNYDANKISETAIGGMIRNISLRELRAAYMSSLILNGYKIINSGQAPIKKWIKTREEINKTLKILSNYKFTKTDYLLIKRTQRAI